MSMKPEFFCCIGAELKDEIAGSLKSSRIFMYRAAESQTIADMLVDGFFNEADDLRVNDLILLYCPEKQRAINYVKVSSVSGGVVKTATVNIDPQDIPVDTTGYSNISGSNLKQVLDSIDAEFSKYLKLDGSTTMTGVLKMRASVSFECALAPYWHGVGLYKLNDNDSVTLLASMEATDGWEPGANNTYNMGTATKKWKNLYLAGTAYITKINNGYDIAVPVTNSADTFALKSQVDDAANSGEQLYSTGVWYAKMYAATVVPTGAEYDGRNYADFSQVDSDNNPVIKIYTGASGAWTLTDTITPPANHNGYMTITSKIWDIAEQSGQQGGLVLWSWNNKTFTPYPRIVSFESINITGNSTVTMPGTLTDNSIPNKKYVDDAVAGAHYHPDLFDWKWADHQLNDIQWLRADTFSWQDGGVYEAAYDHLVDDIDGKSLTSETIAGTTVQFYLADDGHKICPDSEESNVTAIYTATGVAWYYILDTVNQRFKLPRIDSSKAKLLSDPSISLASNGTLTVTCDGADRTMQNGYGSGQYAADRMLVRITPNPSGENQPITYKSGISATLSGTTSFENAGSKYLYFYVGSFTQEAIENTAGLNAELFNDKVDTDFNNTNMIDYVVEKQDPSAGNNYTWYRKYKSGWVEQGGIHTLTSNSYNTITLTKEMADSNYFVSATYKDVAASDSSIRGINTGNYTTTSFQTKVGVNGANYVVVWEVKGMAA